MGILKAVGDCGGDQLGRLEVEQVVHAGDVGVGALGEALARQLAAFVEKGPLWVPVTDRTPGCVRRRRVSAAEHATPPNRVGGFPVEIEIWCSFRDGEPERLTVTSLDPAALVIDVIGGRRDPDGAVAEQSDRWWGSWSAACEVGLGLEHQLRDGLGPGDITALYALGLGEESPEEHFRAKIDAGELAVLPLGAPTNAVDGAQAAALGHSVEDWRDMAWRRLWLPGSGQIDDPELSAALAGPGAAALPAVPQLNYSETESTWTHLAGPRARRWVTLRRRAENSDITDVDLATRGATGLGSGRVAAPGSPDAGHHPADTELLGLLRLGVQVGLLSAV